MADILRDLEIDSIVVEYRNARKLARDYSDDDVFALFATEALVARYTKSDFNPDHIFVDGMHDTGIDGLAIIIDDQIVETENAARLALQAARTPQVRLVLVQATTEKRFSADKVEKFLSGARDFFRDQVGNPREAKERNKDVKEAAAVKNVIFEHLRKEGMPMPELMLYYVAAGHWRDFKPARIKRDQWLDELRRMGLLRKITHEWIDVAEIIELRRRFKMRNRGSLRSFKLIELPRARSAEVAYIGAVLADDLVDLVGTAVGDQADATVFFDNVRSFLGANSVNVEIARTIEGGDLEIFALLSNGVTIVCRQCESVADRFQIYDYQIINGCQTSHVLYEKRELVLGKGVLVPAKLVVSRDPEMVRRIIESSNRQSGITKENLLALLPFNRRLESFYAAMRAQPGAPQLYYEVRQGEHSDKSMIDGAYVLDTRDQIQAYAAMFLERANSVISQLASLFSEIKDDQILSERHRPDFYYLAGLALYRLETLIVNERLDARYNNARYYFLHVLAQRHFAGLFVSGHRPWSDAIDTCRDLIESYVAADGGIADFLWAAAIIDKAAGGRELTPRLLQTKTFLNEVGAVLEAAKSDALA